MYIYEGKRRSNVLYARNKSRQRSDEEYATLMIQLSCTCINVRRQQLMPNRRPTGAYVMRQGLIHIYACMAGLTVADVFPCHFSWFVNDFLHSKSKS